MMPTTDPDATAELIESIHQPWKSTLADCLRRWNRLDPFTREQSYLVIQEQDGRRRTLHGEGIAELAKGTAPACCL
jgi:hypothetical protein